MLLDKMKKEVEALRNNDGRLLESKNYEVFLTDAKAIPNIMQEIGRLREITFREVGEGTNEAIDLDPFDSYYHHMFYGIMIRISLQELTEWDWALKYWQNTALMGFISRIYFALNPSYIK